MLSRTAGIGHFDPGGFAVTEDQPNAGSFDHSRHSIEVVGDRRSAAAFKALDCRKPEMGAASEFLLRPSEPRASGPALFRTHHARGLQIFGSAQPFQLTHYVSLLVYLILIGWRAVPQYFGWRRTETFQEQFTPKNVELAVVNNPREEKHEWIDLPDRLDRSHTLYFVVSGPSIDFASAQGGI